MAKKKAQCLKRKPRDLKHGSADTSRAIVPHLHSWIVKHDKLPPGAVTLDMGGGRFEKATEFLAEHGVRNLVYDPYNRTPAHNKKALAAFKRSRRPRAILISNVLNVIRSPAERAGVLREVSRYLPRRSVAWFTVYERNADGKGCWTQDGWQENRRTASYVPELAQYFGPERVTLLPDKVIEVRI
jgi:hypothetical protein